MTLYSRIARHLAFSGVVMATNEEVFLEAVDRGIINRRWICNSDKGMTCDEEIRKGLGYLHDYCHWYYDLWTVDFREIEAIYQKANEQAGNRNNTR